MMNNAYAMCAVVAFFWTLAPILGRYSGLGAMMMTVLVAVGTLVATLPVAFSQNYAVIEGRYLTLALAGGVANGIGLLAFYRLVAGAGEGLWEISSVLPMAYVAVPLVTAFAAWMILGEAMTVSKAIGLAFAGLAIWFLS